MKKLLLLITLTISIASYTAILEDHHFTDEIRKTETETIDLDPFDAVKTSQAIEVEIVKSEKEKAVVTSNHLSDVKIEVKNKILYVQYRPNVSLQNADTKVVIYAKDLKRVEVDQASIVKVKSIFNGGKQIFESKGAGKIFADSKSESVHIKTNSAGGFSGKIETENLTVNVNAAGIVKISGLADHAVITADNAGSLDAKQMKIKTAKADASATSSVILSISEELTATASSLAKIRYRTLSGIRFSAKRSSGGTIDTL
nr:DUF2807 domain-containing protein [uncultured Chryseobacterium sp.]